MHVLLYNGLLLTTCLSSHSVSGHAKIVDKFLSDSRCTYHDTVVRDKIVFFDSASKDPDWKVRQCYMLIIASATEIVSGIDNLWKSGPSAGRHTYPDFGQYMPINYFKAFCCAAPFCWSEERYWYEDTRDVPWDVFLPCLSSFNDRRQRLIKTVLMLVDESMSGWRPKTTKLGGLPNYTFEPRKPVPLGTMFRNGVECVSGILVVQDVVQNPEQQSLKPFYATQSSMPDRSDIMAHTAEVLRLVEGAKIPKNGWVGGDSWFGSTTTAVEVMNKFGVHSSWIIKQNQVWFPMKPLFAVLKARYKDRPAGHWVTFQTKISGVDIIALAYAWSQRRISFILSTCGSTRPAEKMYMSYFEDDYGNVGSKEISRPELAHLLYDYLPLIDEHNKQRQKILGLERKWPTRNCWFRLLTTLMGMCIVDMHRLYRNVRNEHYLDMDILEFSDLLCKKLTVRSRRQTERLAALTGEAADNASILERITDKDGNTRFAVTDKQIKRGRNVGKSMHQNCYICRKYLTPEGDTVYNQTTFRCSECKMPLCKKDRSNPLIGRDESCILEHVTTKCEVVGCLGSDRSYLNFPREKQIQLISIRLTRNMRLTRRSL
jgi:hypothetical protein